MEILPTYILYIQTQYTKYIVHTNLQNLQTYKLTNFLSDIQNQNNVSMTFLGLFLDKHLNWKNIYIIFLMKETSNICFIWK